MVTPKLVILALLFGAGPAAAEPAPEPTPEHVWIYAGIAMGGGSGRFGPLSGTGFVDGHVWLSRHVGVFATALGYGASEGEQSGKHASGSVYAGGVSVRKLWRTSEKVWPSLPCRAFGSFALGRGQHHGTEWVSDDTNEMRDFADTAFAWTARAGIAVKLGPVFLATQLVGYGFELSGFAIAGLLSGSIGIAL